MYCLTKTKLDFRQTITVRSILSFISLISSADRCNISIVKEPVDVFVYPVLAVGFYDLVENKPLAIDMRLNTPPHRFSYKLFVSKMEIGSL